MAITEKLLNECRDLAMEIAPELRDGPPVYIMDSSAFDGLPNPSGCLGWADFCAYPDYARRERIEQWDGPGPIVALDESAIRDAYGTEFEDGLRAVLVHEVGHLVQTFPKNRNPNWEDLFTDTADLRCAVREKQISALADDQAGPPEPSWSLDCPHGARFIIRTCHLFWRARISGQQVSMENLFGGDCWWMAQPAHYLAALLPQLYDLRNAPFSEIDKIEPTPEFKVMWNNSLEFFRSFRQPRTAAPQPLGE